MKVKLSPKKWKKSPCPHPFLPIFEQMPQNISASFYFFLLSIQSPKILFVCQILNKCLKCLCISPQYLNICLQIFLHFTLFFANTWTNASYNWLFFHYSNKCVKIFLSNIRCRCCLIYLPIVSQTLGSCLWPPLQSLFIANIGKQHFSIIYYSIMV